MKIFLTGGTGFIGSHVVKLLSDEGYQITVLARNPDKVPALSKLPGVQVEKAEIYDFKTIQKLLPGHEACIHIALHWGNSPTEMLMNDTQSSVCLFEMAAKAGVKEFIYTSSTAVNDSVYIAPDTYGKNEDLNVYENSKQRPLTYYGATKGATELFLNAIAYEYKIKANIVRPGYTYGNPAVEGAYTEPDARFKDLVESVAANNKLELIKNDGTQFIWAADLAKIYLAILKNQVNGNMYFGLATNFISWESIAREAVKELNSSSEIIVKDLGWSDTPVMFDVSAIKRDFNLTFNGWAAINEHIRYFGK